MFTLKLKTTYQLHTFLNNQVGIFSTIFLLTCDSTGNDPPQHVYSYKCSASNIVGITTENKNLKMLEKCK